MITRIYLRTIAATWLVALLLPWCWSSVIGMACWTIVLALYLAVVLAGLIDADHFDHRLLPSEPLFGENGLPMPSKYPAMPGTHTHNTGPGSRPYRFVGCSERKGR